MDFVNSDHHQSSFPRASPFHQVGRTLRQILINEERLLGKKLDQDMQGLTEMLCEMAVGAKIISSNLSRASIVGVLGLTGKENVQGEAVKYMDELSNHVMLTRLLESGFVAAIVTEEEAEARLPPDHYHSGKFVVAIDPLDGSSNIDCNVPTGTIFGVHRRLSEEGTTAPESDYLRPGRELIGAGYILYGPAVMFCLTLGNGVMMFTYDHTVGEFILTAENVKIPDHCKCFSLNEGNIALMSDADKHIIDHFKTPSEDGKYPLSCRYVGSMVSDFHRNLTYGGLFMYPGDSDKAHGKLRLLYECSPLTFIAEQAGGLGMTESGESALDVIPKAIHQRSPLYLGNKKQVEECMEILGNSI